MTRRMLLIAAVLAIAILGLFIAGCGDDDDDQATTAEEPTATTAEEPTATTAEEPTATTAEEPTAGGSAVIIEVLEEEDPGGFGPFTASGAAVDEGIICAAGEGMIISIFDADSGEPPPWPVDPENLLVDWQFICADGSGQFTLQLSQPAHTEEDRERAIATGGTGEIIDEGSTWETLSGTGNYTTLTGDGSLTFEILDPSGRPARATWIGHLSIG